MKEVSVYKVKKFIREILEEIKEKINTYDNMAREEARLKDIGGEKYIINEHSLRKWENEEASRVLREALEIIKKKEIFLVEPKQIIKEQEIN